jgi:sulfhydrogenase subunit beta (sulfur reductase)
VSLTIIQKNDMAEFVANLIPDYRVVGPVEYDGTYRFAIIEDVADLRMDYTQTILPPKKYLLPTREALLNFSQRNNGKVKQADKAEPTVIVGVHTCDLHAIHLLDLVHTTGYIDPNYMQRRQNTLIISIECLKPCTEQSFCKSMGTLTADEGYDLHLTDLGDCYSVDVGTEAGQQVIEKYAYTSEASQEDIKRLNNVLSEKWPKFPYRLDFDISDLPSLLNLSMKSPLWAELGDRCCSCAACTNVCPTCFCFDVKDEVNLDLTTGSRIRSWDSCQLDQFATVAGGHNFRESRALRQRHRFMRKGKYILEAHGYLGCVGCGRCGQACLVDITMIGVLNELYHLQEVEGAS